MRLQDNQSNCGPFALKNALAALGIDRSAEELERACGTTATKGTPTRGILKAATKIDGCNPVLIREKRRDVALLKLRHAMVSGRPAVIVWSAGEHWVAVVGMLGERFLVADSADNELILSYTADELAGNWLDVSYEGILL